MHILIIRTATALGGAEIYNIRLIQGFRKYYPDVSFSFITNFDEFGQRLRELGVPVELIPIFNEEVGTKKGLFRLIKIYPIYIYQYLKAIRSINKKRKIDIILMQSTTEKIALSIYLLFFGFRILWLEHGMFETDKKIFFIKFLYKIFKCPIITVSNTIKEDLKRLSLKKIIVVKTGFNIKSLNKKVNKLLNPNKLIISFIGSISDGKGIKDFFIISQIIIKKKLNVFFTIVGTGPKLAWLKNTVNDSNKKYYSIKGSVNNINPYINKSDLLLFPTYSEGLSLVILELMANGIPVITRDIGGNNELVIHNKTGLLFKNETHEQIAQMAIDLLNDPERRKKMGEAARERIKKYFSEERWIREMNQVFQEVTSGEN